MTLDYDVIQPLQIPDDAYTDDIATIVVTGGSYGGIWALHAISTHQLPDDAEAIGGIETAEAPRQPDAAFAAAHRWIQESCAEAGLVLAHFKSLNSTYSPGEAPFFCGGQFFIDRRRELA